MADTYGGLGGLQTVANQAGTNANNFESQASTDTGNARYMAQNYINYLMKGLGTNQNIAQLTQRAGEGAQSGKGQAQLDAALASRGLSTSGSLAGGQAELAVGRQNANVEAQANAGEQLQARQDENYGKAYSVQNQEGQQEQSQANQQQQQQQSAYNELANYYMQQQQLDTSKQNTGNSLLSGVGNLAGTVAAGYLRIPGFTGNK